jgi:DNA uptake protein ComE-like DNA-binding protein
MKLIITCLLTLGLASLSIAAETPAKKKSTAKPAAAIKPEAASEGPSLKAMALAKTLTPSQRTKLLDLINDGDVKAVQSLPGVGETRAAAIKKARPFKDPVDLVKVDGIGDVTFAEIVAHAKAGFPEATKEEPAKPKTEAKKKAPAKAKTASKKKTDESEDKAKK